MAGLFDISHQQYRIFTQLSKSETGSIFHYLSSEKRISLLFRIIFNIEGSSLSNTSEKSYSSSLYASESTYFGFILDKEPVRLHFYKDPKYGSPFKTLNLFESSYGQFFLLN